MIVTCEPWPVLGCNVPDSTDPALVAAATNAARQFLLAATGRRFGVCTYVERFQVRATPADHCGPRRNNGVCCSIPLPQIPVLDVVEVTVDGVTLDPGDYQIVGGNRLIRNHGCWPASGDCAPGRVEVTYNAGIPLRPAISADDDPNGIGVPESAYYSMVGAAMGELVAEYVEGMCGRPCKLPSRFMSISRQGITVTGLSPSEFLELNLTGLPLTDNLIRTVNPNGVRQRPRVVSLDAPRSY